MRRFRIATVLLLVVMSVAADAGPAADWPRWRGPDGNAVASEADPPLRWSASQNVRWKTAIPGEGSSSPIVWSDRVFLTAALEHGNRRLVYCVDLATGHVRWTREIADENPEVTSALTGHAASTPVTDGRRVIACFGNAGVVCHDVDGRQLWHRDFGEFESELGIASSPILYGDTVVLVCDHDGDRFGTFDSFVTALDVETGQTRWQTDRPELFRSWSTPIIVPSGSRAELVVCGQDELRGYDPAAGAHLWTVTGLTGWVAPSPVFAHGLIFAASGRNGPLLAVRPGGRADVTKTHVVWRHETGGPYVCSPLVYGEELFVHNEQGVLACYDARTGQEHYRQRLDGKFTTSAVAAGNRIYLTNEDGVTFVVTAGPRFELLARNEVGERCLASPAICAGKVLIRTGEHLFCLESVSSEREHLPTH